MEHNIINIENLTKKYYLNKSNNIIPFFNITTKSNKIEIPALTNINLKIKHGESIGIIGDNGAGKTTLLKLISEITRPSTGRIELYGNVASFFDIGFSFHPDLSGLDNIYFISNLMGFTNKQVKPKINDLIDFSEIGDRINTQVKFYSRGMKIKLAFSIIAFIEADILLFDEISFLGEDIKFRKKINQRLQELKNKKTILLVSHYLEDIKKLCDRVVWLENGEIKKIGITQEVINDYIEFNTIK